MQKPIAATLLGEMVKVHVQLHKSCDVDVPILIDSAKHQG